MLVSIIAAMDRHGLIGEEAGLPWHLPNDLRRFRAYTWGKPVIMGRKTFESIGKPLPGRLNIILTQKPGYSVPGCRTARTLPQALAIAEAHLVGAGGDEVMIIGGGQVYAEAIHHWDRCYLTVVEGQFKGSTFFPLRELLRQSWHPICEPEPHTADEKNRHPHSFHIIERTLDTNGRSDHLSMAELTCAFTAPESSLERLDLAAVLGRGTMAS